MRENTQSKASVPFEAKLYQRNILGLVKDTQLLRMFEHKEHIFFLPKYIKNIEGSRL